MNKRIVVIGGSAAGPKAASKARRLDQHAEITIIQRSPELSMASCGYPYYVGGVFDDRNQLLCTPAGVVRDPNFFFNAKGIRAMVSTEVTRIDRAGKTVSYRNLETGEEGAVEYDKLIITTGANPIRPRVPGIDLEGITTLQSMRDADFLRRVHDEHNIQRAVVIGGGLIGIETCEALNQAGTKITLVERLPQILSFLDRQLAKIAEGHAVANGVQVITSNGVAEFLGTDGKLTGVKLEDGTEVECELAIVAVGVRPNSKLAADCGLEIGELGGITVNEYMQTSDPDIYAAGDCVESTHRITGKKVHAPFGDLANLQGRVAGQNVIAGNTVKSPGTLLTGVCKLFDDVAGSTGLNEESARQAGYKNVVPLVNAGLDMPGFMGGKPLISKMVVDGDTGKVLGFQCIGNGDASKRIAEAALAIQGGLTVDDLVNADLPYAPPFSLAIDHLIACAHVMENKLTNRLKGISAEELKQRIDSGHQPLLLDARSPAEFEEMRLGIGETLIPLGALRSRIGELPEDRDTEIVCYCKISLRGYEAALILEAHGYRNVKVLEGGLLAWPYPKFMAGAPQPEPVKEAVAVH